MGLIQRFMDGSQPVFERLQTTSHFGRWIHRMCKWYKLSSSGINPGSTSVHSTH